MALGAFRAATQPEADRIEQALPVEARSEINESLGQLADPVRAGVVRELATPVPTVPEATADVMEAFGGTEAGAILLTRWGHDGPR